MVMQTVSGNGHANGNDDNGMDVREKRLSQLSSKATAVQNKGTTMKRQSKKKPESATALDTKRQPAAEKVTDTAKDSAKTFVSKDANGDEIRQGMIVVEIDNGTGGEVVFVGGTVVVYKCKQMAGGFGWQSCDQCKIVSDQSAAVAKSVTHEPPPTDRIGRDSAGKKIIIGDLVMDDGGQIGQVTHVEGNAVTFDVWFDGEDTYEERSPFAWNADQVTVIRRSEKYPERFWLSFAQDDEWRAKREKANELRAARLNKRQPGQDEYCRPIHVGNYIVVDGPGIGQVRHVDGDCIIYVLVADDEGNIADDDQRAPCVTTAEQISILPDFVADVTAKHDSSPASTSLTTTQDSRNETIHIGDFVFVHSHNGSDVGGEVVGIFGNEVVFRNRHASDGFDSWGADELINISLPKSEPDTRMLLNNAMESAKRRQPQSK